MSVAMLGISIPRFVLAPLLVLVFALNLYWLPVARWETWRHMVLPVICAGLPTAAYMARLTRGGMLEVIRCDFVRTARAKGLSERAGDHAARAQGRAAAGGQLSRARLLRPVRRARSSSSTIFDIPGMGRYFVEAALNRDYNLVMGVTLVYGSLLMVLNAVVDVAYALLDPRVKLDGEPDERDRRRRVTVRRKASACGATPGAASRRTAPRWRRP